ncbi:hypothetical protein NMY22_g6782 [Coprinellus aureogranulatus]|nr:hypothetical protein NMY22_g6782 [Coprinellus aureogranulatus]
MTLEITPPPPLSSCNVLLFVVILSPHLVVVGVVPSHSIYPHSSKDPPFGLFLPRPFLLLLTGSLILDFVHLYFSRASICIQTRLRRRSSSSSPLFLSPNLHIRISAFWSILPQHSVYSAGGYCTRIGPGLLPPVLTTIEVAARCTDVNNHEDIALKKPRRRRESNRYRASIRILQAPSTALFRAFRLCRQWPRYRDRDRERRRGGDATEAKRGTTESTDEDEKPKGLNRGRADGVSREDDSDSDDVEEQGTSFAEEEEVLGYVAEVS